MSTQQDIYASGPENRPPMLNKENYVSWSSRLLRCETAQEIWLRVQQMMKGSDIGIKKKKAKFFNEWERFTSTDGESIESYYHRFLKLMNDLKQNKHFPEKIVNYTQLYDFLKYNQKEVDDLKAKRLARTQDPLALMATSKNPYTFPDITDPTTAMNMALALMAKPFKLYYSTPTNNNQKISSNLRNRQIAQPGMHIGQDRQMQMVGDNGGNQFRQYTKQNVRNLNGYNDVQNVGNQNPNGNGNLIAVRAEGNAIGHNGNQIRCYNCRGAGHFARNCTVRPRRRDAAYLQTQLLIAQKEEAGIQLQAEEFDLMAGATDLDEIKEVNANYGSTEVHNYEDCYDNEIFNMFTQEEQYTELLEPIPEPHQVPQNDNNVISEVSGVEQSGGTVEQHPANVEETLDARVQNFEIQFLKEAAKFVRDFKYLAKEADESLAKHKALELEIERLLRAVVSQDIMFVVQNNSVDETSNLQTELELTSNSIPTPQGLKVMKNVKVIAPEIFRINPFKPSREERRVPNKVRASVTTNPITVSQPLVLTKKVVNSDSNGLSSTGVDNTKTRRPQIRVLSASKSSRSKNKEVEVEEHHRKLMLSRNKKHMSSECNNVKLATQNVKSKVVCTMCNQKVKKTKKVGSIEILASPKPSKPRSFLRWSPTGRMFDLKGKIIASTESESQYDYSKGDNACTSNPLEPTIKRFQNSTFSLAGNRTTNLYTINLHETAFASPICLKARATSTKSWLWHQRLSHLNFDTINDLAKTISSLVFQNSNIIRNIFVLLVSKEKSKRTSHPSKPIPNSRQRLHLLHMDLCGPMRIASINGKRYVLVIVDDYSCYTWVQFLRTKDEAPEVIKTFLKRISILLQSHVIIIRTDNDTEFKNQVLKEYFDSVGISHQVSSVRTPQQKGVVERKNRTLV
nr:putative ribonuclease H-like domain-containing protein [Tanacetum cinerariifolium]